MDISVVSGRKAKTPWTFGLQGLKSHQHILWKQRIRACGLTSILCSLFPQNATLKELNVCGGDTLVVTEEKLPPKVK